MASQDNSTRRMRVLTLHGVEFLNLTPDEASLVAHHWNAVRNYLEENRDTLRNYDGKTVANRALQTDPITIEAWAISGDVRFESIYEDLP